MIKKSRRGIGIFLRRTQPSKLRAIRINFPGPTVNQKKDKAGMSSDQIPPVGSVNFNDPMQVAVRLTQFEGLITTLQAAQVNASQHLSSAIEGLQMEVREVSARLGAINALEHERQRHSEGLERAFEAIAKLSALNERQWEQHSLQENAYRERVAIEYKNTRDKMLRWSGGSIAGSVLLGTIVALVTWIYTTDKANNERDIDNMRAEYQQHLLEADRRFDKLEGVAVKHCVIHNEPCEFSR